MFRGDSIVAKGFKTGGRPKGTPKTGGRVAGTPNKSTRHQTLVQTISAAGLLPEQIAAKVDEGSLPAKVLAMTPLEILYAVMHRRFAAGDLEGAVAAAREAAPYVHARLAHTELRVRNEFASKSDAELVEELAMLDARLAAVAESEAPADTVH
jgi:hypothetical protein